MIVAQFDPAVAVAFVMLAALTLYALLGGADFGAGAWDLLASGPRARMQRHLIAKAIGPVWEVNHIWLILVVVLMFTAFPRAFVVVMTHMHVPLSLMLVGIVMRGSAFTFRGYDNTPLSERRWNRLFSIPSVIVPVLLGSVVGSLASGRIDRRSSARVFESWYSAFPMSVGGFSLSIFAFLAAVYLTLETDEPKLRNDFRLRALISAALVGACAYLVYTLASWHAPRVFARLQFRDWGFAVRVATGGCAILAVGALWFRWFGLARIAAVLQVALILWGCVAALDPYLVPPDLTIANCSSPRLIQQLLLIALLVGSIVLIPSLFYLFWVFKAHAIGGGLTAKAESDGRG